MPNRVLALDFGTAEIGYERSIDNFAHEGSYSMEKIPLTKPGYDKLNAELKHLKSVERPAIIRAISEAREHGDLSENAEYHSAKEKQSFIEGRVKELEGVISLADVIDLPSCRAPSSSARRCVG